MDDLQRIKELTEKLVEAEDRLLDYIYNLNVGVIQVGPDRKIIDCNPKFAEIVGRSLVDLIGLDVLELHHETSPCDELFAKLLGGQHLENEKIILVLPDGSPKVCHIWSSARFFKNHFINSRCVVVPR